MIKQWPIQINEVEKIHFIHFFTVYVYHLHCDCSQTTFWQCYVCYSCLRVNIPAKSCTHQLQCPSLLLTFICTDIAFDNHIQKTVENIKQLMVVTYRIHANRLKSRIFWLWIRIISDHFSQILTTVLPKSVSLRSNQERRSICADTVIVNIQVFAVCRSGLLVPFFSLTIFRVMEWH